MVVAQRAQLTEEVDVARDAAARSLHRFHEHGGDLRTVPIERSGDVVDVVVAAHVPVVGDVHRARPGAERDHATVVAVREHHDLASTRVVRGHGEGHEVRLGARVREPDLLDRVEAFDEEFGEAHFVLVDRAERPPAVECVASGVEHGGRVVAEEARRVVPEEVDVLVAVDVAERSARSRAATRNGNGSKCRTDRVLPPGWTARARSDQSRLIGRRAA